MGSVGDYTSFQNTELMPYSAQNSLQKKQKHIFLFAFFVHYHFCHSCMFYTSALT